VLIFEITIEQSQEHAEKHLTTQAVNPAIVQNINAPTVTAIAKIMIIVDSIFASFYLDTFFYGFIQLPSACLPPELTQPSQVTSSLP